MGPILTKTYLQQDSQLKAQSHLPADPQQKASYPCAHSMAVLSKAVMRPLLEFTCILETGNPARIPSLHLLCLALFAYLQSKRDHGFTDDSNGQSWEAASSPFLPSLSFHGIVQGRRANP